MKKLKLKALGLGAKEILSREQLKNVLGGSGTTGTTGTGSGTTGSGDGHCRTGSCSLFVSALGITVQGVCTDYHTGGSIRCACVNGNYSTDPNSWSACNL